MSTVNVRDAGVWSTLPAGSVARTSKVCSPSASVVVGCGAAHGANGPPSTRHSKVASGVPSENSNSGVASVVVPDGPGGDRGLRRLGVDREAPRGGGRVDVAGAVDGAGLEGVLALGE